MQFTLGRLANRIDRVSIVIESANTESAGYCCQISARLLSGDEISIEDTGQDIDEIVGRAITRIGRTVNRRLRGLISQFPNARRAI